MGNASSTRAVPAPEPVPAAGKSYDSSSYVSHKSKAAKPVQKNVESLYILHDELGSGAFSTVYRGTKKDTGEVYAIKHIAKKDVQSEEDIQALMEEVGILEDIHHPHVMQIFGFYEDPKYYSLVTELVVGGELFDRIVARQHYNESIARDLVRIFLDTLNFLHSNGIVHRGRTVIVSLIQTLSSLFTDPQT